MRAHRRELLDVLPCNLSEAESPKHKTRLRSKRALGLNDRAKLRHDHVFQRSRRIRKQGKARAPSVDGILKKAFASTVTVKENARLSEFGKKYDGWPCNQKAGIVVIHPETDQRAI